MHEHTHEALHVLRCHSRPLAEPARCSLKQVCSLWVRPHSALVAIDDVAERLGLQSGLRDLVNRKTDPS